MKTKDEIEGKLEYFNKRLLDVKGEEWDIVKAKIISLEWVLGHLG